ncbi:glutamate receptor ionotropic, delta-1-like, partial [Centruroides sculpturatus]|uniref:glutamate receptor ionotropic, delta-1-like n=1 Tax=Centruroides sculpturatus TaxID=218467 RepID=UPI000C6E686E
VPATFSISETTRQVTNSGFMSRLFIQIQEYLGFSYELNTAPYAERNNLLKNNTVDIAVPVGQRFERLQYMDFSQCYVIDRVLFFIRKPLELSKITAILRPFFFQVWIAIFVAFIICLITFSLLFWMDSKLQDRRKLTIYNVAWALFGSFAQKGSDVFVPSGQSCRILVTGWVLALYVITASYAGALMSFITFPGFEPVPRTYSELLKMADNGDYVVGVGYNEIIFKFIESATGSDALRWKRLLKSNKLENVAFNKHVIPRVMNEKFAYIFYEAPIEMLLSRYGSENFLISKDGLFTINIGFGMSKSFPYKRELNKA